jgi:hypothetical protein
MCGSMEVVYHSTVDADQGLTSARCILYGSRSHHTDMLIAKSSASGLKGHDLSYITSENLFLTHV